MAKEKFEIDEIKEPDEEIDLDEVISEDDLKDRVVSSDAGATNHAPEEPPEEMDALEEAQEESKPESPVVAEKPVPKKKNWLGIGFLILLVALLIAAGVLGGVYLASKKKQSVPQKTETVTDTGQTGDSSADIPKVSTKDIFVSVVDGLRLRKEPSPTAEILDTMPFGTKLIPLSTSGDWTKVEYNGKTGWCMTAYTSPENPFVYKNTTYGFSFTFKAGWAGYKFIESKNSDSTTVKTYYIAIPTTDPKWDESSVGIPKGYASLFVMGIYTKEEWSKVAAGEVKPGKLGEGDKFVYTYLPGQAYAADLKVQYAEINDIIKTFEIIK